MKKILLVIAMLVVVLMTGCNKNDTIENSDVQENQNSQQQNSEVNSTTENQNKNDMFVSSDWVIQFDEKILGDINEIPDEVIGSDYKINFRKGSQFMMGNIFKIYLNEGNYVEGIYNANDSEIKCQLIYFYGEYSPVQNIDGNINFKINSDSEIEIVDIPNGFKVMNTRYTAYNGEWIVTDESKEMSFWPLVKGIKYTRENLTVECEK